MRSLRPEFCEQIVSKCNRNAFRLRRKAFEISNFLVAGACNHPNVPTIPFCFELHPNHLKGKS